MWALALTVQDAPSDQARLMSWGSVAAPTAHLLDAALCLPTPHPPPNPQKGLFKAETDRVAPALAVLTGFPTLPVAPNTWEVKKGNRNPSVQAPAQTNEIKPPRDGLQAKGCSIAAPAPLAHGQS